MALPKRHFNEEQAQARRQQILDAARACFSRSGFRGASMAEISKTAGMSPGHIYNYFASKHDIITAIVAADMEMHRRNIQQNIAGREDVLQALIDFAHLGVERALQPEVAALNLEIMAEAARNPEVRASVKVLHDEMAQHFTAIIRAALPPEKLSDADFAGRMEAIPALFEGLSQRAVLSSELNQESLLKAIRIALQALLMTPSNA